MVQTRSQKAAVATALQTENKREPKKKTTTIIYRGFVISGKKYQANVDRFYEQQDQHLTEKNVLTCFWLNTPKIILPPDIPIEFQQKMLITLVDNELMWQKLDKAIQNCVVPHEPFLMQPDIQLQIKNGQFLFSYKLDNGSKSQVDLTPLNEFSYWIRLIQTLFCSIQSYLLQECEKSNTKLDKALIARDIYRVSVACRRLISHPYAFSLRFYATQIRKLIEFFNYGMEFVLYAFGIFHPEMVSDDYYPFLQHKPHENLYGIPELAIPDEDPIFGEAKKKFRGFY